MDMFCFVHLVIALTTVLTTSAYNVDLDASLKIELEEQNVKTKTVSRVQCNYRQVNVSTIPNILKVHILKSSEELKKKIDQYMDSTDVKWVELFMKRVTKEYLLQHKNKFKSNTQCIQKKRWKNILEDYIRTYKGIILGRIENNLRKGNHDSKASIRENKMNRNYFEESDDNANESFIDELSKNKSDIFQSEIKNIGSMQYKEFDRLKYLRVSNFSINETNIKEPDTSNMSTAIKKEMNDLGPDYEIELFSEGENGICEDYSICSGSQLFTEFLDDLIRKLSDASDEQCKKFSRTAYDEIVKPRDGGPSLFSILNNETIDNIKTTMHGYLYEGHIITFKHRIWKLRRLLMDKIYSKEITDWNNAYQLLLRQLLIDLDDLHEEEAVNKFDQFISDFTKFTFEAFDHEVLIRRGISDFLVHFYKYPNFVTTKLTKDVAEMLHYGFDDIVEKKKTMDWKERIKDMIEKKYPMEVPTTGASSID